jgi:serine protease AprX
VAITGVSCLRQSGGRQRVVRAAAAAAALRVGAGSHSVAYRSAPLAAGSPRSGAGWTAVRFDKSHWGDPKADKAAKEPSGEISAAADPGSVDTTETAIWARRVWLQRDSVACQMTGQCVTVALLHIGAASVEGLSAPGKIMDGPDLSVESNRSLTDHDAFGHGTHLAGIIAGHDPVSLTAKASTNDWA